MSHLPSWWMRAHGFSLFDELENGIPNEFIASGTLVVQFENPFTFQWILRAKSVCECVGTNRENWESNYSKTQLYLIVLERDTYNKVGRDVGTSPRPSMHAGHNSWPISPYGLWPEPAQDPFPLIASIGLECIREWRGRNDSNDSSSISMHEQCSIYSPSIQYIPGYWAHRILRVLEGMLNVIHFVESCCRSITSKTKQNPRFPNANWSVLMTIEFHLGIIERVTIDCAFWNVYKLKVTFENGKTSSFNQVFSTFN